MREDCSTSFVDDDVDVELLAGTDCGAGERTTAGSSLVGAAAVLMIMAREE